jgi:hypothetical protein
MSDDAVKLYLELMKKTLSFLLWEEPGIPIELYSYKKPPVKRFLLNILRSMLKEVNLRAVRIRNYDSKRREDGGIWPVLAHTMIGLKRLDNIELCVEDVLKRNIEGDLIETGVWRGGACIFMRAILKAYGVTDKRVFVADSFEGLPKPDEARYPQDKGNTLYIHIPLRISLEEVQEAFRKYGLLDEQVVFLKGWFEDTLPKVPSKKFSVMRLDGDMYRSTMEALVNLYPKLQTGGFCIIDDYALNGCRMAVDEFRLKNGIKENIQMIDSMGVYWKKEREVSLK